MKKSIFATIIFVLMAGAVNAQIDWNITGSGARAAGMGNAFIGIADDATAVNWNPGGLTVLEHLEASFVGGFFKNGLEYNPSDNIEGEAYEDYGYSYDHTHLGLEFASIAYPFKIGNNKIVAALALQKQLDFFQDYSYGFEYEGYYYDTTWGYYDYYKDDLYEGKSDGGVYSVTFGAAYQMMPYLSLGACFNIWTGSFNRETENGVYEYYYYEDDSSTYEEEVYTLKNSKFKNFKGFNLALGTLFDMEILNENIPLKIGAVVKTPFELSYDLDYSVETDIYSYNTFEGYDYNYSYSESSYTGKVEMPFMLGVGASYRFGDFLTVSADFERRLYGDSREKQFDSDGNPYEPDYLSGSREDLNQFRIGMEYLIVTDDYVIPVRLGAFNYPTLNAYTENNFGENTETIDQAGGFGISFGTGMIFDKFAFDLSYTYLTHDYNNVNIYSNGNEYKDEFVSTKNSINFSTIIYIDSFMK